MWLELTTDSDAPFNSVSIHGSGSSKCRISCMLYKWILQNVIEFKIPLLIRPLGKWRSVGDRRGGNA